ncbi:fumarylacetoacetate hydrolase family protein [Paenibacillus periandrae]|uniref:fumarylacetoacetate hydrolase family protein n=1 Tax=Paenibacillus periandrae TaxID=1761741 RepID=UPI001F093F7B|nr:fumarylacetoacetate hydrolase family protein [Paenibacillus periandrae]
MKLASYKYKDTQSYGVITENGVIDLKKRFNNQFHDLKSFIANHDLQKLESDLTYNEIDYALSNITYLPVIVNPDKIICIGLNYDEHRIEANRAVAAQPTIFFRFANSQIGHLEDMIIPNESAKLDYEGEIAVIIGRSGRRIAEEHAYEYVAGYSCYNDGSVRDWQQHTHQWGPGKNFVGTGAFGPWMVTRGEIGDGQELTLETRLNGEVMQHATTEMLLFSIPELISYVSTFTQLEPGDVIVTGTPGGVGSKRNPAVYMKQGDVVEVEVSQIGKLINKVSKE